MRFLVLGGGLQGSACAWDLLRTTDADVTIADARAGALHPVLDAYRGNRLSVASLDARDHAAVRGQMTRAGAVLSALPYYLNADMARLAVDAGVHFADLGGNMDIVRQQQQLDAPARARAVSVMADCGLAPGLVNILAAEGIRRLDTVESVRCYVGGLPQDPHPPLNYTIVYSLEGVLDYYTTPSWILRDGRLTQVEALSELETIEFPPPAGRLEAFHTAGGISTMPWDFEGRVPSMEYKTLRYPGHAHVVQAIRGLGLLSTEPVVVAGTPVRPRDLFVALVDARLRRPDARDLVALRVVVVGRREGKGAAVTFSVLDLFDEQHGMSAMMRTTGYSLSVTGQFQMSGTIPAGVTTAYQAMPFDRYVSALADRDVRVETVDA